MRILGAMRAQIAESGYLETSIADVISRAGVSRKTFYAQFADKEDCFVAIYEEHVGRLHALARDAFDAQDEWIPSLRAGLTALLAALSHDPPMARVCFVDVLAAGPRAAERRSRAMRELEAILELARDGAGESPAALRLSMIGGLSEVLYQEIVADRATDLPKMLPELMYALVLPFEGREAAERELTRAARRTLSSS
jgi:AcrR family transcriptional regulator